MARVEIVKDANGDEQAMFHCPGCEHAHAPHLKRGDGAAHPLWTWNGSLDRPTFLPSILVTSEYGEDRAKWVCHSFVTDGQIQFLGDCTHALAGQTVDLPEVDS